VGKIIVAVLLLSSAVHADKVSDAREHLRRGTAHYAVGEFAAAAEEYQAGFMLMQDPALLYNAAQAYRLAGNHEKALVLYRNFLNLFPNEKNIAEVKAHIVKLKHVVASSESARQAPPHTMVQPRPLPPEPVPAPSEPKPAVAAPSEPPSAPAAATAPSSPVVTEQRPAPVPVYKRWWLWTIIGVAAAGVGVGLGLGLSQPSDPRPSAGVVVF
jgi:tetratricopeptide (TPR) repeat protein